MKPSLNGCEKKKNNRVSSLQKYCSGEGGERLVVVIFSETGEEYVGRVLKPVPKMAKIYDFLYLVNSALTKQQ